MSVVDRSVVHGQVVEHLAGDTVSDADLMSFIEQRVKVEYPLLSRFDTESMINAVFHDVTGFGFLEDLLNDPHINEIMVNSTTCAYIDKAGTFEKITLSITTEELVRLVQKIASSIGAQCDVSHPILDAWLPDGSRLHAVLPPIAPDGPTLTIRRFVSRSFHLGQFCRDEQQESIVRDLIEKRKNIVVAGGTSSGKTTLLNSLIHFASHDERIVSIEETSELSTDHPHWVRLLARSANSEGAGTVSMGDLVKASLRMRPDRIVVGEVRSAEAFDLVQALNTGHDGSLCTIHANGPEEVTHRLASLALFAHPGLDYSAIVTQITYGIDAVIYVSRNRESQRSIDSICTVERHDSKTCVRNVETQEQIYV